MSHLSYFKTSALETGSVLSSFHLTTFLTKVFCRNEQSRVLSLLCVKTLNDPHNLYIHIYTKSNLSIFILFHLSCPAANVSSRHAETHTKIRLSVAFTKKWDSVIDIILYIVFLI